MLASSTYVRNLKNSEAITRNMDVATFNGNIDRKVYTLDGDVPIVTFPSSMATMPDGNTLQFILL